MNNWEESVRLLEEWQQITLGAALVTRMMPNYALFCDVTGTGSSTVFGNILNLVWEFASGQNAHIDFDKQQDKLEAITPDPEQFDLYGVWPALDAVVALASLLSASERFSSAEISAIATLSHATIIHFLEATGEGADDPQHPLLLADRQFCRQVQQQLEGTDRRERKNVVKSIRARVSNFEDSNIGLVNSG